MPHLTARLALPLVKQQDFCHSIWRSLTLFPFLVGVWQHFVVCFQWLCGHLALSLLLFGIYVVLFCIYFQSFNDFFAFLPLIFNISLWLFWACPTTGQRSDFCHLLTTIHHVILSILLFSFLYLSPFLSTYYSCFLISSSLPIFWFLIRRHSL